ncbi:hypothetical protein [Hyphomicrobium sp. CS1GBMeth3]|uniref:hypothetical protein n=1 Tax=Hyphomicrobium sp. CS1GBMeth3 TaxID=1892845 RepID=UPI00111479E3|nr:hypothetical protein [Hyphomicrobium sp. CS1GBMeth3]
MAEKTAPVETGVIEHVEDVARNELTNRTVIDSTKSVLTTHERELRRAGVTPQRFHEAYEVRNDLYQALASDPEVQGIVGPWSQGRGGTRHRMGSGAYVAEGNFNKLGCERRQAPLEGKKPISIAISLLQDR